MDRCLSLSRDDLLVSPEPPREITIVKASIPDVCDECREAVRPGEEMVLYVERCFTEYSGVARYFSRHYCKPCGELLRDSLLTTEEC